MWPAGAGAGPRAEGSWTRVGLGDERRGPGRSRGVRGWLWGGGHGPGCGNRRSRTRRPDRRLPSQAWPGPPVFAGLLGTGLAACPLPPSGLPPCPGAVPSTRAAPAPPPATARGPSSLPKRPVLGSVLALPSPPPTVTSTPRALAKDIALAIEARRRPGGGQGQFCSGKGRTAPGRSWESQEGLSLLLRCPPAGMDPGEWEQ